jgi:uncharacterized 2Fe-2S/4Fe-4S cluster protein (DUF4445 family)
VTFDKASLIITVSTAEGELHLPFQPGATVRDILNASGIPLQSACGGNGACGQCQIRLEESEVVAFTAGERLRLSSAQLAEGLRLACQIRPLTDIRVSLTDPVIQTQWRVLRNEEYSPLVSPPLLRTGIASYGVAIDLGTTHIRLSLWHLASGKRIAGRVGLNPQCSYGADVLARLTEASHSIARAREIGMLAAQAIGAALAELTSAEFLDPGVIGEVVIVGNTAMMSLLSGKNYHLLLQAEYWTRMIDVQPDDATFLRAAWALSENAVIHFVPPLGGFIGSDLLAGIIATRLMEQPAPALLIDFGTNSEIALWDGRLLHVTSAAGGPAFEGSGISCGMPGDTGAIYRVEQQCDGKLVLSVLGDGNPVGVCGSGLVDAIAWLCHAGKLDKVGRFKGDIEDGFVLSEANARIVLQRRDIDVFQRAKAAIAAGVRWLCDQAGARPSALERVFVCGAFGGLLNVAHAQAIGLLPGVVADAVVLEGNAALAGCEMLLVSDSAGILRAVQRLARVHNLAEDMAFERLFVENLYLQPMQE